MRYLLGLQDDLDFARGWGEMDVGQGGLMHLTLEGWIRLAKLADSTNEFDQELANDGEVRTKSSNPNANHSPSPTKVASSRETLSERKNSTPHSKNSKQKPGD